MKRSGTAIILVVVWAAVLLASYGIGLYIREVRFRHAQIESKTSAKAQTNPQIQKPSGTTTKPGREPAEMVQVPPDRGPMPGGEGRMPFGDLSEEERAQLKQKWDNMSEEERQQEREKRRAEMQERRAKFESMSEEEKEKFKAEMQQRFGNRRSAGRGQGRRPDREQQQQNE